jgi:hypothetical protein
MNDAGLNDDAEFDAFLAGKGALSELLSELKGELQDEFALPSAELDSKIMADAQAALTPMEEFAAFTNKVATLGRAPMQRNPVTQLNKSLLAANDAMVHDGPAAWPQARWLWRWRVALGVAASVLLFFPVVFKLSQESPMSAAPALNMPLEKAMPAATQASLPPPPPEPRAMEKKPIVSGRLEEKLATEAITASKMAPAQTQANRVQNAAPTANAPAPPAALADTELPKGLSLPNKVMKKPASPEADAPALLTAIEQMILDKKIPEALEAWQKFRQTYPDYVLTPAQEKQIEALKAQK